mgnify:CR=1 FL=1
MKNKMYKKSSFQAGFTVIELSIVLIISGLMITMLLGSYKVYMNNQAYYTTRDHLERVDSALNTYRGDEGEYPCPSDPTLPSDHDLYGKALKECDVCVNNTTRPLLDADNPSAGLSNVICVQTTRDADGDSVDDFILIGGLPFSTLADLYFLEDGFREYMGQDGYYNQFTYAVSANMAADHPLDYPVNRALGAVTVVDENNVDLSDPPSTSHYVVISHGLNGMGAYTLEGLRINQAECRTSSLGPIPPGLNNFNPEKENCDDEDPFFKKALRSLAEGDDYFDDIVLYRNTFAQSMWEITTAYISPSDQREYMYNTNIGDVGVNIDDPDSMLHIDGNTKVDNRAEAEEGFCDATISTPECMDTDLFSTYDDSDERWQCEDGKVAIGIQNNGLICEDLIDPDEAPPEILVDCRNLGGPGIDYNVTGITYDRNLNRIYASGCAAPSSP